MLNLLNLPDLVDFFNTKQAKSQIIIPNTQWLILSTFDVLAQICMDRWQILCHQPCKFMVNRPTEINFIIQSFGDRPPYFRFESSGP